MVVKRSNAEIVLTTSKLIFKCRSCSADSPRKLWRIAESIFDRTQVLETMDQRHFQGERPCCCFLPRSSTVPKEDTNQSLYRILEVALTRISVLGKGWRSLTAALSKRQMERNASYGDAGVIYLENRTLDVISGQQLPLSIRLLPLFGLQINRL